MGIPVQLGHMVLVLDQPLQRKLVSCALQGVGTPMLDNLRATCVPMGPGGLSQVQLPKWMDVPICVELGHMGRFMGLLQVQYVKIALMEHILLEQEAFVVIPVLFVKMANQQFVLSLLTQSALSADVSTIHLLV